jgi:CopG family nickel-responsive transcriptional regulator
MAKITRVGVTFPPDLLRNFDLAIDKMGYASRSKAIQDAVRLFVSEHKWIRGEKGAWMVGLIALVYDHEAKGLEAALTHVQHEHSQIICSAMHVHLSKRDCLQAIIVKGEATEIKNLAEKITAKKGVKQVKIAVIST